MVQHFDASISDDGFRGPRRHSVSRYDVTDIAVDALVQLLDRVAREEELRRADLLCADAIVRKIHGAPEFGDLPNRQLARWHQVLSKIRRLSFAFDSQCLDLFNAVFAAKRV